MKNSCVIRIIVQYYFIFFLNYFSFGHWLLSSVNCMPCPFILFLDCGAFWIWGMCFWCVCVCVVFLFVLFCVSAFSYFLALKDASSSYCILLTTLLEADHAAIKAIKALCFQRALFSNMFAKDLDAFNWSMVLKSKISVLCVTGILLFLGFLSAQNYKTCVHI